MADRGYENQVSAVVAKLLLRGKVDWSKDSKRRRQSPAWVAGGRTRPRQRITVSCLDQKSATMLPKVRTISKCCVCGWSV